MTNCGVGSHLNGVVWGCGVVGRYNVEYGGTYVDLQ